MAATGFPADEHFQNVLEGVLRDLPDLLRRFDDYLFRFTDRFQNLVADVTAAILEGIEKGRFKQDGELRESLRRYAFGIAQHMHADFIRKVGLVVDAVEQDILDDAAQDSMTASRVMAQSQARIILRECLLKLDEKGREMLFRKYLDKAPLKTIAAEHELSEDAADHRLRAVRSVLRSCLGSSGAIRFELDPR